MIFAIFNDSALQQYQLLCLNDNVCIMYMYAHRKKEQTVFLAGCAIFAACNHIILLFLGQIHEMNDYAENFCLVAVIGVYLVGMGYLNEVLN